MPPPDNSAPSPIRKTTHDLANLIGVILGNVDLALSDTASDHPAMDSLREIQKAAREARALCTEMRNLTSEPTPSAPHADKALKFILIDDDEGFRSLFDRTLRRLGHSATAFANASEALQAFNASPASYDVVVTDLNMPGANGIEVAVAFLQRAPGNLRVCLTSADLSECSIQEAKQAGINCAIRKPNTLDEFGDMIRQLVDPQTLPPKV